MPFCTGCGAEVKDGVKFCGSCGAVAGGVARSAHDDTDFSENPWERKKNNAVWIVVGIAAGFVALIVIILATVAMPRNTFTDTRDKKTYRTVKIGNQTWMAENLNYKTGSSKCYGEGGQVMTDYDKEKDELITKTLSAKEIQDNCAKYGRLYTWKDALKACPAGWHLPTDAEWDVLMVAVGGVKVKDEDGDITWETAGEKLKSKTGWEKNGNGTDEYGFSALPGGVGNSDGYFDDAGDIGYWWSATESGASVAWGRIMYCSYEGVDRDDDGKTLLLAVRCVRD